MLNAVSNQRMNKVILCNLAMRQKGEEACCSNSWTGVLKNEAAMEKQEA